MMDIQYNKKTISVFCWSIEIWNTTFWEAHLLTSKYTIHFFRFKVRFRFSLIGRKGCLKYFCTCKNTTNERSLLKKSKGRNLIFAIWKKKKNKKPKKTPQKNTDFLKLVTNVDNLLKHWTNDSYHQKQLNIRGCLLFWQAHFFLLHRCAMKTGHHHKNKLLEILACGLSFMLYHADQNKIRKK